MAVQTQLLADDIRSAAKAPLPQAVTDHRHRMRVWYFILFSRERAAQDCSHSKHVEEVTRHYRTGDQIRLIVAASAHSDAAVRQQSAEDLVLVAVVQVVRVRRHTIRAGAASV